MNDKYIQMKTKSGMKFTVSFSEDPPDFKRLARFFMLLGEDSEKTKTKGGFPNEFFYR